MATYFLVICCHHHCGQMCAQEVLVAAQEKCMATIASSHADKRRGFDVDVACGGMHGRY
jgi:hypothetical protein